MLSLYYYIFTTYFIPKKKKTVSIRAILYGLLSEIVLEFENKGLNNTNMKLYLC